MLHRVAPPSGPVQVFTARGPQVTRGPRATSSLPQRNLLSSATPRTLRIRPLLSAPGTHPTTITTVPAGHPPRNHASNPPLDSTAHCASTQRMAAACPPPSPLLRPESARPPEAPARVRSPSFRATHRYLCGQPCSLQTRSRPDGRHFAVTGLESRGSAGDAPPFTPRLVRSPEGSRCNVSLSPSARRAPRGVPREAGEEERESSNTARPSWIAP